MDAPGRVSPTQSPSSTQSEPDAGTGVVTSVAAQRQSPQGEPLPSTSIEGRKVASLPYEEPTAENFGVLADTLLDQDVVIPTDQEAMIAQQAQRIQSLENDLAATQATLGSTTDGRDYFQQKAAILENFQIFLDKNNLIKDIQGVADVKEHVEKTMEALESSPLSQAGTKSSQTGTKSSQAGTKSDRPMPILEAELPISQTETIGDSSSSSSSDDNSIDAGSPSADPLRLQPKSFDSLFEKADQLGIPRLYVALGYPICTQTEWPKTITSYTELGDPREFKPQQEEQILQEIANYCKSDIKQIKNLWLQASFLETFIDKFKRWLTYDHDKFQTKLAGVKEVSEGVEPDSGLYTQKDQQLMTSWQDAQKKDDRNAAFTPGIWQPAEWLDTLAKAHRDPSPSKAMQLAGLWADFSFLIAGDMLTQKSRVQYQINKNCFNWREFSPSTPVAARKVGKRKSGSSMPPQKKNRNR